MEQNNETYLIEGENYPRVTRILGVLRKEWLENWRGKIGNAAADEIGAEARGIGTEVHRYCAQIMEIMAIGNTEAIPELIAGIKDPQQRQMAQGFASHVLENIREVVCVEKILFSKTHRYAGTVDFIAWYKNDDQPHIADIKTSGSFNIEMALQTAAYGVAAAEMGLIKGSIPGQPGEYRRTIIRLPKDKPGAVEIKEYSGKWDFNAFLCCLGLYSYLSSGGGK